MALKHSGGQYRGPMVVQSSPYSRQTSNAITRYTLDRGRGVAASAERIDLNGGKKPMSTALQCCCYRGSA